MILAFIIINACSICSLSTAKGDRSTNLSLTAIEVGAGLKAHALIMPERINEYTVSM